MSMDLSVSTFQQILVFGMGCCIGSFLNVVIYRLPQRKSLVHPGSHCPHCGNAIAFYDNIPLLSYVMLMGKCRHCRASISPRYPAVEAIVGLLALVLFMRYGFEPQFFIEFVLVSLLLSIAFIDLDTFLIPDVLSVTGVALGFATSFISPRLSWIDSLLGVLIGGGFLYLIAVGYQYLRHQDGLGGGDIKLLGMIGAFLGVPGVVLTALLASVVGAVVGLVVISRSGEGMKTMIPFGPFLSMGALIYTIWGESFLRWYLGLMNA
jgi:leader peptidase (prepilin peptidase)/N-methyltransferase